MEAFELSLRPVPRASCRVRVGIGALDALVEDLARDPPGRLLVVITDERVGPLHAGPLAERLSAHGLDVATVTLEPGEPTKTRATKAWIEDRLLALGAGRDSAIVAVGGGVVGDIAGFVAATWQRGIPVVQVPTTLLSMVDAALGGKTAVNHPGGKNLIGAFHQPWGVYADLATLATLDEADYVDGFSEMVKSAAIADAAFFRRLELSTEALAERSLAALDDAVARCLQIKARVVRRDERESGRRAVLNFGHTVAHAIEAASGYRVRHGRAVAIGLSVESAIARRETGFPKRHADRLRRLLEGLGLPVCPPPELGPPALVEAARRDKKNRESRIHCALPVRLGRMLPGDEVTVPVGEDRLLEGLRESRTGPPD